MASFYHNIDEELNILENKIRGNRYIYILIILILSFVFVSIYNSMQNQIYNQEEKINYIMTFLNATI
jgi:hypothetical protein